MENLKSCSRWLAAILFVVSTGVSAAEIIVYKSPTCGCCKLWIEHLEQNGFKVKAYNTENVVAHKQRLGLLPELASCHTAVVNGYVIEGHVPATDIKRLLKEKPKIAGLAVPTRTPRTVPTRNRPEPRRIIRGGLARRLVGPSILIAYLLGKSRRLQGLPPRYPENGPRSIEAQRG